MYKERKHVNINFDKFNWFPHIEFCNLCKKKNKKKGLQKATKIYFQDFNSYFNRLYYIHFNGTRINKKYSTYTKLH